MDVQALADHAAMSRRQLGRVVTEQIGFSPKQFARIARFDHAVRRVRSRPSEQLSGIAFHTGYADQAHMTRDFRAIGGIRPADLRRPGAERLW